MAANIVILEDRQSMGVGHAQERIVEIFHPRHVFVVLLHLLASEYQECAKT